MIKCRKCNGKIIEDIVYYDEEAKNYGQILQCLYCAREVFLSKTHWEKFKRQLDNAIKNSKGIDYAINRQLGKASREQVVLIA